MCSESELRIYVMCRRSGINGSGVGSVRTSIIFKQYQPL